MIKITESINAVYILNFISHLYRHKAIFPYTSLLCKDI